MTHSEKVLALLSDGEPHSHREMYGLFVMVHSRVADLRKRGHDIRCWREGDIYLYQLQSAEPHPLAGSAPSPAGDGDAPSQEIVAGNDGTPAGLSQLTLEEKFAAFYVDTYAEPRQVA